MEKRDKGRMHKVICHSRGGGNPEAEVKNLNFNV